MLKLLISLLAVALLPRPSSAIILDGYFSPEVRSHTFNSNHDFESFFKSKATKPYVSWTGLRPRSYVISVDFTLSQQHGVKLLEINGSPYHYGSSAIGPVGKALLGKRLWYLFSEVHGGSGHQGHDILYAPLSMDHLIYASADDFVSDSKWRLRFLTSSSHSIDLKMYPHHHSAWFLSGDAFDAIPFKSLPQQDLILNHSDINSITSYKPLLSLLPNTEVSVPTKTFRTRDFDDVRADLYRFSERVGGTYFILKPADGMRSEGVKVISRETLLNPGRTLRAHLKQRNFWVYQPYWPSDFESRDGEGLVSPVGRIFYHLIFDGKRFAAYPLTAYKKLNGLTYEDPEQIKDPTRHVFGPLSASSEFTKPELEQIIGKLNAFFEKAGGPLFQMAQNGIGKKGDPHLLRVLREEMTQLTSYERKAIRSMLRPYTVVSRLTDTGNFEKPYKEVLDLHINPVHKTSRALINCRSTLNP